MPLKQYDRMFRVDQKKRSSCMFGDEYKQNASFQTVDLLKKIFLLALRPKLARFSLSKSLSLLIVLIYFIRLIWLCFLKTTPTPSPPKKLFVNKYATD